MLGKVKTFINNIVYDSSLFIAIFINNIKSNFFLFVLFLVVEMLNYVIFFHPNSGSIWAFWTITGTIISILVTLILIQPSNLYQAEKGNMSHTQKIITNIYYLFYLYIQISRIYTQKQENQFFVTDYYTKSKYKHNMISDLNIMLEIIKPISTMEIEKQLRQQYKSDINQIFEKLKETKEIFLNIPYDLSINYIRYDLIELFELIEQHYFKGGCYSEAFAMISDKYLKLLIKMNKNQYIYLLKFIPLKKQYITINCTLDSKYEFSSQNKDHAKDDSVERND